MISTLRGTVIHNEGDTLVLETNGIGREIHVTATTAARLPSAGAEVLFFISPSYAMYGGGETLYGFLSPTERALFCTFRDEIPGTGAKKALEYLNKAVKSLPDFRRAVIDRDQKLLCAVFGFTQKTAIKIIDALKDKIEEGQGGQSETAKSTTRLLSDGSWGQALAALESLGYKYSDARATIQTLSHELAGQSLTADQIVRQALKRL